jgi:hypothetical protein
VLKGPLLSGFRAQYRLMSMCVGELGLATTRAAFNAR